MQSYTLKGQLLVAMPTLKDPLFAKTVIYLVEHSAQVSTGFIINKPVNLSLGNVLPEVDLEPEDNEDYKHKQMLFGGPVKSEQLFMVLPQEFEDKLKAVPLLKRLTSKDLLESLIRETDHFSQVLIFFGYASWTPGQLEKELRENSWLVMPADIDLLYKVPYDQRYHRAMELMGFDSKDLSADIGHA